ncbi:MAG: nucleoid-associated protein [Lachnospiraceae bacterium]|nr:nucleoid-associated protein [Lachnospiraceae bacterium]
MRASDILVKRCVFCVFDINLPYVNLTEVALGMDDQQGKFVYQLMTKYYDDINAKKAEFTDEDFLGELLAKGENPFESFVTFAADEIHHMMINNPEIQQGSGIFIWAVMGEEEHIMFFKLNYQAGFICQLAEDGLVNWKRNTKIIPAASKKCTEYLYINLASNKVKISDFNCYVDSEKCNYLADKICKLQQQRSEKETVESITTAIEETIQETYEEKAPEKILESRQMIANLVAEKGEISNDIVRNAIFADNEEAQDRYTEKTVEERLPKETVYVSNKMEKRLARKQKIVTDSGIEILVPLEYLRDPSIFEYVQDETGKICIMIKDAGQLM